MEFFHADHSLTQAHKDFLVERFSTKTGFFLETIEMPEALPSLPCGLHGPLMGDEPIQDSETTMKARGERPGLSRRVNRANRPSRLLSAIGGIHEGKMWFFTAYGGPVAPKEVYDTEEGAERKASEEFWADHALGL